MADKKPRRPRKTAEKQSDPNAPRSVPVFFHAEEIVFLINALNNLPMQGTPDVLAQALPMIQGVRLKIAQAGVALGLAIQGQTQTTPAMPEPEPQTETPAD